MPHKILTIAGSDTLAGGGLQADLATFSNYNFFGLSVTTSIVTVTPDDFQIFPLDLAVIAAQLESALALDDIIAVKIGFCQPLILFALLPNIYGMLISRLLLIR